jgi:hypothetical protein
MTTKHTPGPWIATYDGTVSLTSGKERKVANAYAPGVGYVDDGTGTGYEDYWATATANAHLIAAAPDMLEALEECLLYLNNDETRDLARAAISKAKGTP